MPGALTETRPERDVELKIIRYKETYSVAGFGSSSATFLSFEAFF
jgi:hypothetical protein